jgi:hypothetical protein
VLWRLRRVSRAFRDRGWVPDALARLPRLGVVAGETAQCFVLDWRTMRWQALPRLGSPALAARWRRAGRLTPEQLAGYYATPKKAAGFFGPGR